jgi:protein SCO1/2/putative membrane protein
VPPIPARAGHEIPPSALPLGDFHLLERSGRTITNADLAGRVWIAAFIFTRCPLSCPRISSVMKELQARLARTDVLLVSISVDPEYDTPPVLSTYAQRFGASPKRWWFLTGSEPSIHDLVVNRFKLSLGNASPADRSKGAESITHSDRLALVDRGQIIGFFASTDQAEMDALVARASRLALPDWVRRLPAVNASLNALCALFLLAGWTLIRGRHDRCAVALGAVGNLAPGPAMLARPVVRAHATCMLTAVAISTLFLVTYLVYHSQAGSVPFPHGGMLRVVYLSILLSHTALATFGVVPLVILTLFRALRRDFTGHVPIAQVTLPIWLYVSVTGVVIYLMLHAFPVATQAGSQTA